MWRALPKPNTNKLRAQPASQGRFCNDQVRIYPDERYVSSNQNLVGAPNPKTLKPVVIVPPSHAQEYWMANHVVRSNINDETFQELYQSGYAPSNCCGYVDGKVLASEGPLACKCDGGISGITYGKEFGKDPGMTRDLGRDMGGMGGMDMQNMSELQDARDGILVEGYEGPGPRSCSKISQGGNSGVKGGTLIDGPVKSVKEGYCDNDYIDKGLPRTTQTWMYPYRSDGECTSCCSDPTSFCPGPEKDGKYFMTAGYPGDVDTICGYDPEQILQNNLPSNQAVGKCQKDPVYDCYNKFLNTQMLGPDTYTRSEITEPIQSNIGISFTQQFPPVTCEKDCNGGTTYVSHDPRMVDMNAPQVETFTPPDIKEDNVYDPRFSGYGTSYRTYIDELTGQPRFYYDDIDAVRRPNFIIRSNIDDAPWADSYGPVRPADARKASDFYNRSWANNKFLKDSLQFRNSLQQSYMRKVNSEAWQQRSAPLRRDMGSCFSSCK
jgi:hypothetical protein